MAGSASPSVSVLPLLTYLLLVLVPVVTADGIGIIGAGKWMYKPTCAHACRRLIANCPLLCSEDGMPSAHHKRHNHGGATPPECFLKDRAFLRTQALCMSQYCPRDNVAVSAMEEYWEGHLATGSVGDWSGALKPIMSYSEALMFAREDVEAVGEGNMPTAVSKKPLNQTSLIAEEDWLPSYNGQKSFEDGENGHGANSLAIAITTVTIPILLSFIRFLPARWTTPLTTRLDQPFFGHRHRTPLAGAVGLMPTRGQALFIAYILITNIFLVVFPHSLLQPNYIADSDHAQLTIIVGDRAGVLAFANFVAIFLFSSRNNVLLWLTDWSHSTFLLLHRWVAYACIGQTVLHSTLMWYYYAEWSDWVAESKLPYWYWGIIGTLALCLILPLSVLPIRRRVYEAFLAGHQVLAVLVLVACFLHIWYLFEYKWGYEIWIYIAGGLWGLDRILRVLRVVRNGICTATVSIADSQGDYMRVEIEGIAAEGHVYLYFPTLSWRFWENHPFSVLSSFSGSSTLLGSSNASSIPRLTGDPEKTVQSTGVGAREILPRADSGSDSDSRSSTGPVRPCTTFLVRPQTSVTRILASRVPPGTSICVPVLVESSYHANPAIRQLAHCSTLLCIAGGVGISAVIPVAKTFGGVRARLCWGVRDESFLRVVDGEIAQLGSRVEVETRVGERLPIADIVVQELTRNDEKGDIGVVVCGPAGMADDVRKALGELVAQGRVKRGVVFIDEAFSW
ncbi:ferric reductase transmembrane component 4 [Colletotrichum tabaci]|uniref:Ferric reductase transmembrane component 4 n=1 Tax=Colletotrichum tabaci TaxID=1209068 RepID=A0AAV9T8U0_9PEZI